MLVRAEVVVGGLGDFRFLELRHVEGGRRGFREEAEFPCTGHGVLAGAVAARAAPPTAFRRRCVGFAPKISDCYAP